jgi:biotin transport system permease protein
MLGALTVFRSLDIPPALNLEGLTGGLLFSGGILISFSACSLLFTVTTMTEIRRSLERAEFLIRRIIPGRKPPAGSRGRLSLAMALMLGFLPQFFVLWEEAELACRARGASRGLRSMGAILPLVTERMIKTAAETAETLEARGLEL